MESLGAKMLSVFFNSIEEDARIGATHISVYFALIHYYIEHGCANPIYAFSHEIMKIAKISTRSTYYKSVNDLNDYGYIRLETSHKRTQGSKIYIALLK